LGNYSAKIVGFFKLTRLSVQNGKGVSRELWS